MGLPPALLASLAPFGLAAPPVEVEVPGNDGWVTDLADMLAPEQERELELLMESYKQGSEHEIAVLTVPDLDGNDIERFALVVAREWGLGGKETHDGALLVVARAERKLRIEVGRGLEGDLPDVIAARIIRDVITPAFKRGDFAAGIKSGVLAMHAAIGGDYGPLERSQGGRRSSGGVAFVLLLLVMLAIGARRRGRGGRGGVGSILPWLVLSSLSSRRQPGSWSAGGFGAGSHGGGGSGGFGGFGGGGGFSGGGASGGW